MCAPLAASRFARSYDPLDRIDLEAGPAGSRNHDFDPGGNRTTDGAGTTASFTPATDRLATINGVSVTLDAAGNLTSDGSYQYLWNSLGQLAELRKPDNTLIATYYYDHQNLRTRKVTTAAAPQGVSKTFYHYDQAGHLIAETTPGNTPQTTYIWNGDILTGFIVHQPTRTVYTVQTDHLGSPFQVRTLAGQVVWRWESEAFGKTAPNEDVDGDGVKLTLNLRFPGQYFDRESGLHYNWNRYYSPRLARYISPDPIGLSGGPNLFAYAEGNPLRYSDPLGLWVKRCARGLGDKNKPPKKPSGNPIRHDYLSVSGQILSFQAGDSMAWSQGFIDDNEYPSNPKCNMVCDDDKFDRYVFEAANKIGAPTYCLTAYPGSLPHMLGARNCQTWADDVLKKAKEKYLATEKCPKCFK